MTNHILFFPPPDYGKNYGSTHFTEACIQGNVFSWGPFLDVPHQDNTLFNGSFFLSYITSRFCAWSLVWNSRFSRWFLCHLFVAHLHLYYVSRSDNTETKQVKKCELTKIFQLMCETRQKGPWQCTALEYYCTSLKPLYDEHLISFGECQQDMTGIFTLQVLIVRLEL